MPTSRYEYYPILKKSETKEEIVGECRLEKQLGQLAIESPEKD